MSKLLKLAFPFFVAAFAFVLPINVLAQQEKAADLMPLTVPVIVQDQPNSIFRGQDHKYAVTYRGNGEAIVYANIVFTNTTDNAIKEFVFDVPADIADLTVYQYRQDICNYGYRYDESLAQCTLQKSYQNTATPESYPYYGANQNSYTKAKFTANSKTYTIALPFAIKAEQKGYLLMGYTTKQGVTELFGKFDFTFTTLKVNQRIENVRVGINVDGDLVLKNATSSVNYAGDSVSSTSVSMGTDSKAVPNSDFDALINSLGYSGVINKSFKGLAAGETVEVKGEYAASTLRLYAGEICIALVVIVLIIIGLALLIRSLNKRNKNTKDKVEAKVGDVTAASFVMDVVVGFISAILVVILTVSISALTYYGSWMSYGYGFASTIAQGLITVMIILAYILVVVVGPAIRGAKYGWKAFLAVFVSELVFLLLAGVFVWLIIAAQGGSYYRPYAV
jgi:hypothetical protein